MKSSTKIVTNALPDVDRESAPRRNLAITGLLIVAAALVFSREITLGGMRFGDACTHVMDGVLIHDWILAGPKAWLSPMEFALRQYAHYPTLGIGRVYPPGFAVVESGFFLVFGVSIVSARVCTVAFGLLAIGGCLTFVRRTTSPLAAVCAAGCLLAMPGVVHWTRQTMLEMPTLAVLIWAVVAGDHYLQRPTWRRWSMVVGLMLIAPMFKQTAIFIIPVLALPMVVYAWRKRVPAHQVIVGAAVVLLPPAMVMLQTLLASGSATHMADVVAMGRPMGEWLSWEAFRYYPQALPEMVGWIITLLAACGFIISLRRPTWRTSIPLIWFGMFFVMSVLIQHREQRYFFFGFFPIAVWAGIAAAKGLGMLRVARVRGAIACALVGLACWHGYRLPTWLEPDYRSLVETYKGDIEGQLVLFEGKRDGDFTFAVRQQLGTQRAVILRGSKVLYANAAHPAFAFTSYVNSTQDVRDILESFGLKTLFVERENFFELPEVYLLQEELRDASRYELVGSHLLNVPKPGYVGWPRIVDVYRVRNATERSLQYVDIPIPIDNQTIRIDLDALLGGSPTTTAVTAIRQVPVAGEKRAAYPRSMPMWWSPDKAKDNPSS